jgi:hypothetical protein
MELTLEQSKKATISIFGMKITIFNALLILAILAVIAIIVAVVLGVKLNAKTK